MLLNDLFKFKYEMFLYKTHDLQNEVLGVELECFILQIYNKLVESGCEIAELDSDWRHVNFYWKNFESDICQLSKDNPEYVFCFYRYSGDWECFPDSIASDCIIYFHNGKIQLCEPKITFDEFSFEKLEDLKL